MPSGSPWLFPCRQDPQLPLNDNTFRLAFNRWQRVIGLHAEAGEQVHVVPHQLRHSLATRLINQGVPQHVIQRLLGHASPGMTAVYARLHDSTLREEMERYWKNRVDVEGRLLGFDPEATTADAEWLKHNLGRAADSLPNGYCGRPPRQECPHPNACLTCPDFQTTVQFLPVHRRQYLVIAGQTFDCTDVNSCYLLAQTTQQPSQSTIAPTVAPPIPISVDEARTGD